MKFLKNYIILILFIIICSTDLLSNTTNNSLLWKISGNGLAKPSYIYGTIHVHDKKMMNFSDSVLIAFDSADLLAEELNSDSLSIAIGEYMLKKNSIFKLFSDTATYNDFYTKSEYDSIDKKLKANCKIGMSSLKNKNPLLIFILINMKYIKFDKSQFSGAVVDNYFFKLAKMNLKPIIGIEHVEEQIPLLHKFCPASIKKMILSNTMNQYLSLIDSLKSLYRNENIDSIYNKYFKTSIKTNAIMHYMTTERNVNMCNRTEKLLKDHSVFIAVGVAHLPGDSGLINLFRLKGYKVEPVQQTYTGYTQNYRTKLDTMPWITYYNSNYNYQVRLPFQPYTMPEVHDLDFKTCIDWTTSNRFIIHINYDNDNSVKNLDNLIASLKKIYARYKFHIISSQEVKNKFKDAKAFKLSYTINGEYYYDYYIRQNNSLFYYLNAVCTDENQTKDVDRFFDSFKVGNNNN